MRNIVLVSYNLGTGGIERMVIDLAVCFANRGYCVSIVNIDSTVSYRLPESVKHLVPERALIRERISFRIKRKLNYVVRHINEKGITFSGKILYEKRQKKLEELVLKKSFLQTIESLGKPEETTVISFGWDVNVFVLRTLSYKGYRLIAHVDDVPGSDGEEELIQSEKFYPLADKVVVLTSEMMNYYSANLQKKCCIIPNPIAIKSNITFQGVRKNEIVTFSRIDPKKNLQMLIESFEIVHRKHTEYILKIIGTASIEAEIELSNQLNALIEKKGLSTSAFILPFDPDVHSKIIDSAMFVQATNFEGFGNSLFEAMSLGLPVISTDCPCGAPRTYIKNYENGILVPLGDIDALANAMEWIIENPEAANKMGLEARKIRDVLDIEAIVDDKYEKII